MEKWWFDISEIPSTKEDRARFTKLPDKPSEEIAELIGILTGDGFMNHYTSRGWNEFVIEISGDSRHDKIYHTTYISPLIKKLFSIEPRVYYSKNENSMKLALRSKHIFLFLKELGFPCGKKGQIQIPEWIKNNDKFMTAFLRGFADTDGCLAIKKRNYLVIRLCSISVILFQDIDIWLRKKGFTLSWGQYTQYDKRTEKQYTRCSMDINGRRHLKMWMEQIGFSNERHLSKYRKWDDPDLNRGQLDLQSSTLPG